MYEWKQYWMDIVISNNQPKVYGPVRLKSGQTIYRKYSHPLKNGKGLALTDLLIMRTLKARIRMDMELMSKVFA
jgi:hypothetical protein